MPYVKRDKTGQITAVSADKSKTFSEYVELNSPEFVAYLVNMGGTPTDANEAALAESDQALIRVVDDLVNVLVEKNAIRFTDLPEAAQQKLLERRSLRESLTALKLLGDDEKGLI